MFVDLQKAFTRFLHLTDTWKVITVTIDDADIGTVYSLKESLRETWDYESKYERPTIWWRGCWLRSTRGSELCGI